MKNALSPRRVLTCVTTLTAAKWSPFLRKRLDARASCSYIALMAYDEGLAQRVRETLGTLPGISEKKMFGGLCFLLRGNMTCGIRGDELMVRIGPDGWADALARPHAREMDFTGRSLRGFVYVAAAGIGDDDGLEYWVSRGADFAGSLPPK